MAPSKPLRRSQRLQRNTKSVDTKSQQTLAHWAGIRKQVSTNTRPKKVTNSHPPPTLTVNPYIAKSIANSAELLLLGPARLPEQLPSRVVSKHHTPTSQALVKYRAPLPSTIHPRLQAALIAYTAKQHRHTSAAPAATALPTALPTADVPLQDGDGWLHATYDGAYEITRYAPHPTPETADWHSMPPEIRNAVYEGALTGTAGNSKLRWPEGRLCKPKIQRISRAVAAETAAMCQDISGTIILDSIDLSRRALRTEPDLHSRLRFVNEGQKISDLYVKLLSARPGPRLDRMASIAQIQTSSLALYDEYRTKRQEVWLRIEGNTRDDDDDTPLPQPKSYGLKLACGPEPDPRFPNALSTANACADWRDLQELGAALVDLGRDCAIAGLQRPEARSNESVKKAVFDLVMEKSESEGDVSLWREIHDGWEEKVSDWLTYRALVEWERRQ